MTEAGKPNPAVIILMGVAGAGKTRIGRAVAARLGWPFVDADHFHPAENVAMMESGLPLSDEHRYPWLRRLADEIRTHVAANRSLVVACSALRQSYRSALVVPHGRTLFIHLAISFETAEHRLKNRPGHFFPARLALGQLETLEPGGPGVVEVSAEAPFEEVVAEVLTLIEQFRRGRL